MDSKAILQKIRVENDTLSDLRSQLLLAQGEIGKAEKMRAQTSYRALSQKDEKATKVLEATEDVLAKIGQRVLSIKAAIAESEKRAADLQVEYDEAVDVENWEAFVVKPLREEIQGNAIDIDRHFGGTTEPQAIRPFVAVIKAHTAALSKIDSELTQRKIGHTNFIMLFKRWFDNALHPIFRDSARMLYTQQVRDELGGSYAEFLSKRAEIIFRKHEDRPQSAVNE